MQNNRGSEGSPDIENELDREMAAEIWRDTVLKLWDAVDNLTRLRPRQTPHYHVSIFGSARISPDSPHYEQVRYLAKELTTMGCRIVTGGGPGFMQAASQGAAEAAADAGGGPIGINIELPFEPTTNPFVKEIYEHRTFFSRLHHFVLQSNAFVVTPGGIGTALEALMIWQLLQVKTIYDAPLIMVGHMWRDMVNWGRSCWVDKAPQLADASDMDIPQCVDTPEQAVELVRKHYSTWQAGRP